MRGPADPAAKAAAVRLLTEDLLPGSPLWPLYGERWREPRYYSMLLQVGGGCCRVHDCAPETPMLAVPAVACFPRPCACWHLAQPAVALLPAVALFQPYLLSPAINLGDIAVALQLAPPGTSPEAAVRNNHPFPIFERFLSEPVLHPATGEQRRGHMRLECFLATGPGAAAAALHHRQPSR